MTEQSTIRWDADADGIVTLTLDDPTQRANTMTDAYAESMRAAVDRLYEEKESVTGVIVTSAKKTFFAGGDLRLLIAVTDETTAEFAAGIEAIKADLRRLETLGRPVVAALNGAALGGGLEIALACHHRIAVTKPGAVFGLPEVGLGLLPGGGGVVRATRLLGLQAALEKVLLTGARYDAEQAVAIGIVDEVVASDAELLPAARAWIKAHPDSVQPWDAPDYRMPGGTPTDPDLGGALPLLISTLAKKWKGAPQPAPHHILCAATEGAIVDVDSALAIEGRYFVDLARGRVAKNMIQATWFDTNAIKAGGSRPAGFERRLASKVAVIGAGMMGAGIAYVSALNGLQVVLKDVSLEAAERGKDYSRKLLDKAIARGTSTEAKRDEILARITPTDDYGALAGCDLVVEAVFENTDLKHQVFAELEPIVTADALLGSNTSTLPITSLAAGVQRKRDFIGLHFFSPVDRMALLEVIRGEETSDEALARALDFASQIGKIPIVVNDSRGFFTSRVISTFIYEALAMVGEGVAPASIEQATTQAGFPVGALQLSDELNLELLQRVRNEARAAGTSDVAAFAPRPGEEVMDKMVELGRPGRLRGKGFYDYDESGRRTALWPGLAELFPPKGDPAEVDLTELKDRMLFIQAVESARCVAEGVITATADANVGSITGIGYPVWTGGVLQFINSYPGGIAAFVARAQELAARHGERFEPNQLLLDKAASGEKF
ncbi:MAG: 3-hydroxyacyl-CoA dehydrogenase [Actinomycetota bacterium]|nr:MAG: 3-hydroxyacyl-CoA dehydrogenase [Actinomycetota bacterium]